MNIFFFFLIYKNFFIIFKSIFICVGCFLFIRFFLELVEVEFVGKKSSKLGFGAQGTIEYLVIIAVVVVLSLVVVGLLISQVDNSQQVSSTGNQLGLSTQVIGITESMIDPYDGNFVVQLLNNSGEFITVSNVRVGDTDIDFSENLAQSGSKFFRVDTSAICEEGKVISEDVTVTYVTLDGLTKVERYPAKVMFDCTPYNVNLNMLANQCEICVDPDPLYYGFGTGQTTCYDSVGEARSCTGTGEDGDIYGSFTRTFSDNGDNTLSDESTGLMWQKTDNGSDINWQAALDYCNNLTLGGYSNWHLPNFNELSLMVNYEPSLAGCYSSFTNCASYYWSSTSFPQYPTFAEVLDSMAGSIVYNSGNEGGGKAEAIAHVRCVRFNE